MWKVTPWQMRHDRHYTYTCVTPICWHCILNPIPNATSNTPLNNSKTTKCRLIPFTPWLDKCIHNSIFRFEQCARFYARAFAFLSYGISFRKSHKKRRQNITFFTSVLLYANFCFCHLFALYDFKVNKSIKTEQHLLKSVKPMTPKQTLYFFSQWMDTVQFTLVCQTQDVCGRFQSENWREHVFTGHCYALV